MLPAYENIQGQGSSCFYSVIVHYWGWTTHFSISLEYVRLCAEAGERKPQIPVCVCERECT